MAISNCNIIFPKPFPDFFGVIQSRSPPFFFHIDLLQALMINQWQDYGVLDCTNEPVCVAADGEAVLNRNGIDPAASAAAKFTWRR